MPQKRRWQPLADDAIESIRSSFHAILPDPEFGSLARRITRYWVDMLERVWREKPDRVKQRDLAFSPDDPLTRVASKTVVIAYADSVTESPAPALQTLRSFLEKNFPAIGGIHVLPACEIVENRFNDGYFSQVRRDRIHPGFGTNAMFADLMEAYFSMADFVLNHVDIEHPGFKQYLEGDDAAGRCFYVFTDDEYHRQRQISLSLLPMARWWRWELSGTVPSPQTKPLRLVSSCPFLMSM